MWKADNPLLYRPTGKFSRLFCDYVENRPELRDFHAGFPVKESFARLLKQREKQFSPEQRGLLCRALSEGELCREQKANLDKVHQDNCFTVSCGHQLCIGGGPQYMAFKILTTIRLAEDLKKMFPEKEFVPVFWMAGEDHDLDEVLSFRFFQQTYKMELEGSGAVGRIPCADIGDQLSAIKDFPAPMAAAYQSGKTLAEASRHWLSFYFGEKGLLILDADRKDLKRSFLPVMLKELESDEFYRRTAIQTQKLEKAGYDAQLHIRDLNLFFLNENKRDRLLRVGTRIFTADRQFRMSLTEASVYFGQNPECLSPNAALRPLYSQQLLPDVGFVGGPAEIAYWLQLKPAFELHNLPFPLLVPRFSALLLPENRVSRLRKLGLSYAELFEEPSLLRKKLALGEEEIELPALRPSFGPMLKMAAEKDASLVPALEAEISRMEAMAEGMAKRIRKAAEKKSETLLSQLGNLLEYCFPSGDLLERSESWMSLTAQNPEILDELLPLIDPLDFRFQFLIQEGRNS